ncbi:MAG: DUF72 domain-containing protein [Acidimicrobiia bacterium]
MSEPTEMGPVIERSGARVLVGTCSWTDKTLTEGTDWYPKRTMTAAERLAFYCARYPIVEADSTYYFPPTPELTRSWAGRTPAGFTMNVKAFSLLTGHPTRPASLWRDMRDDLPADIAAKRNIYAHHLDDIALDEAWRRFAHALAPLHRAGKLGAVLMQYPRWFTPKRANRDELRHMRERLGDLPVCVEFRSPLWLGADDRDRTLAQLRDLGVALVVVDAPRASRLPRVLATTSDELAVVRFHGRAEDTWDDHAASAAERFRYLYSKRQLQSWVPKLDELASQVRELHVLMNNCYQDYGVKNAAQFQDLFLDGTA